MDRKELLHLMLQYGNASLSARRAWIEKPHVLHPEPRHYVALRKESVDRKMKMSTPRVMNRKVALRKESVDRKVAHIYHDIIAPTVALRKESVDRKTLFALLRNLLHQSLSARRAWIENGAVLVLFCAPSVVALRKESVDRKKIDLKRLPAGGRRSPQGERG